jgi:hypothetical protein
MAQVVKLKRTAVEGKIPTTATLELGELAINTYDGRIFFEKDNGTPTVQQIITTDSVTTGSIQLTGLISASYFLGNGSELSFGGTNLVSSSAQLTSSLDERYLNTIGELFSGSFTGEYSGSFIGDGSQLTNLPSAEISQVATVTASFQNQSSISVNHNFNSKNVIISVYGSNDSQIIPQSVVLTDNNTTTIGLSGLHSGYVVVAKGGHLIANEDLTTHKEIVSGNSTYTILHNLIEEYPLVQAWNTFTKRQEQPSIVESIDENSISITFAGIFNGKIIIKK